MFNPDETLKLIPSLSSKGLRGAGMYFDGVVDDAKLSLECLYDALLEDCASALSYHEVFETKRVQDGYEVSFRSRMNEKIETVFTKELVFTTGPFTDELLPKLKIPWKPQLVPSKGIHLWLKKDAIKAQGSVVLTTRDNRVVFVIPQREAILVGTTETPVDQEIFDIKATQKEISYLLGVLKQYFPDSEISEEKIISTYAAVRPLAREDDGSSEALGKVSRFHKILRPDSHTYVLIGGKYTTFRRMVQEIAQEIVPKLGRRYSPNLTLNPLRQKSLMPTFGEKPEISLELIDRIIAEEFVTTKEDLIKRRLSVLDETKDIESLNGITMSEIESRLESVRKS